MFEHLQFNKGEREDQALGLRGFSNIVAQIWIHPIDPFSSQSLNAGCPLVGLALLAWLTGIGAALSAFAEELKTDWRKAKGGRSRIRIQRTGACWRLI